MVRQVVLSFYNSLKRLGREGISEHQPHLLLYRRRMQKFLNFGNNPAPVAKARSISTYALEPPSGSKQPFPGAVPSVAPVRVYFFCRVQKGQVLFGLSHDLL